MKINKILLINPPYYVSKDNINFWPSFPLGIGYISSYLEARGYTVKVIDAFAEGYETRTSHDHNYLRIGLTEEEIISELANFGPDLVGISNLFSIQHFSLHSLAKVIKDYSRNLPVVAGGPHISAVPELVMTDDNIDYGVLGEGENTFNDLIGALNNNNNFQDVAGITYREDGTIKVNRSYQSIKNLDDVPFPAWHLFKMDKYLHQKVSHGGRVRKHPFMTIITSRGCPLNCCFCSVRDTWGRCFRARSPENVMNEIVLLRDKFDIKELIIVDDNFNFDIERFNNILDLLIKEKMDLILEVPNGLYIPKLNKDIFYKMKNARFCKIYFPIESGNEYVRNNIIRKPINIELVKELIAYCREINIETGGYFILGLPGETKKQMQDTFKLVRKLKIEPYFSIATPFPGSGLYNFVKEKGLLKRRIRFS